MKELRSYINENGERVTELFDMTQEQIDTLEAERALYAAQQQEREKSQAAQAILELLNKGILSDTEAANLISKIN